MLTGLLFAIEEAVDDPARLVATLPFAGTTLIEHQARQLIAAGAGQIVVIGERESPELVGAFHRIGRRGVVVDAVVGAAAAAARLHPLSRMAILADGLVTTDAVVQLIAQEGGDALLTVAADEAPAGLERIGGGCAWAGVARCEAQRLVDLALLPPDYDPQSTLVRLADTAGASRIPLPDAALRDGHGIERDAAALASRGRRLAAAMLPTPRGWFDRFVAAPLIRAAMPLLVGYGVQPIALAAAAVVLGVMAVLALIVDWPRAGMLLVLAAILAAEVGGTLAGLRDEAGLRRWLRVGAQGTAAAAALLLGWRCSAVAADHAALSAAVSLVIAGALVERSGAAPSRWWGGAGGCVLMVTVATLIDRLAAGLMAAALYAAAALVAAVETLRSEA